jgi:hypothetical protein
MEFFSDGKQVWRLRWTIGVLREARNIWYYKGQERVRLNAGLVEEWIQHLFTNPELVCDLVWIAVQKQHPDRSQEELEDSLYGSVIEAAREALINEIVNFSQDRTGRGKMIRAIADEIQAKMTEAISQAEADLTSPEPLTNGVASLELTEAS